jgi:DNA ligase-1
MLDLDFPEVEANMPVLVEGEPVYIKGSGMKPYELKNVGGVYSCSCPAWRNFGGPIDRRTCKHLKAHCGEANEMARIGMFNPASKQAPQAKPVTASASDEKRIVERAESQGRKLRQDEKTKLNGPPILLAHSFEDANIDPTNWWYSEKLDGVRAYWNGKDFLSRQGNVFHAPDWFKAGLPSFPLDGELWMARKAFQKTVSIVKRMDAGDQWKQIVYVVFDLPSHTGPFEKRMEELKLLHFVSKPPYMKIHSHSLVKSQQHLLDELNRYEAMGAEGLMIRKPASLYEAGRSSTLLKVKPFKDAEAEVIGHEPGKGRHKGRLGALTVKMPNGNTFSVGTGFSDAERNNPPAIGSIITYRYTEHTDGGIPKCGSFVAVRDYE